MRLNELLAIEKNQQNRFNMLMQDVKDIFEKEHSLKGYVKSLKMIQDSPENEAIEKSCNDAKDVVTTVNETVTHIFNEWSSYEDTQFRKTVTNQRASADISIGETLINDVPIDELIRFGKSTIKNSRSFSKNTNFRSFSRMAP